MKRKPTVLETVTLDKSDTGGIVIANVIRSFYAEEEPSRVLGQLYQTTVCKDCYLEEMADGDLIPVVQNGGETTQRFYTFSDEGSRRVYWGNVSYNKARKLSERETSFLGKIINKLSIFISRPAEAVSHPFPVLLKSYLKR